MRVTPAVPLLAATLAVAAAALAPARAAPQDPPRALLDRAAAYVAAYAEQLSSVVAEERYDQRVEIVVDGFARGRASAYDRHRRLVSDYLLVKVPRMEGWIPFRDVIEVDGQPVRDREDRLMTLFVESGGRAFDQAARIAEESSRYNIGNVRRTINVPTLALIFLLDGHRHRFTFTPGEERRIEGRTTRELLFTEWSRPTLIRTSGNNDLIAVGTFWIDPESGLVVQTRLQADDGTLRSEITVTYRADARLALWVPWRMREEYESGGERIQGTATYTNFRKFRVETDESIKR